MISHRHRDAESQDHPLATNVALKDHATSQEQVGARIAQHPGGHTQHQSGADQTEYIGLAHDFLELLPSPCIYLTHDHNIAYSNAAARHVVYCNSNHHAELKGLSITDTNFANSDLDHAFEQVNTNGSVFLQLDSPQGWAWRLCRTIISKQIFFCLIAQLSELPSPKELLAKIVKPSFENAEHSVTMATPDFSTKTVNRYGRKLDEQLARQLQISTPGSYLGLWNEDFTRQHPLSESVAAEAFNAGRSIVSAKRGVENPITGLREVADACVTLMSHPRTNDILGCLVQTRERQEWGEYLQRYDTNIAAKDTFMVRTMLLDGHLDYFSTKWETYFGCSRHELSNGAWKDYVHRDDLAKLQQTIAWSLKSGESQECEVRYRKGTSYRHFSERIAPYRVNGIISRWYCISTDIHELVSQRQEANSARSRLIALIHDTDINLFELDSDYLCTMCEGKIMVTVANELPDSALVGKNLAEILETISLVGVSQLLTAFDNVMQGRSSKETVEYKLGVYEVRTVVIPVKDDAVITGVFGVTMDLSQENENKRATTQIEAMEASSRIKDEFVANVSHELRTPIAGLLGLLELLFESPLSEEQLDLVQNLQTSAVALSRIVNDILDFAKSEANAMLIEKTPFDLSLLLSNICKSSEVLTMKKSLKLQTKPLDTSLHVRGDALRLRQILDNLLSNAIKFTDRGFIRISTTYTTDDTGVAVRIVIEDSGLGMDEETTAKLFQPFVQADQSTTRLYGGTGLGLSIARKLARAMGGDITLTSTKGVGTTSVLTVPFDWDPEYSRTGTRIMQVPQQPHAFANEDPIRLNKMCILVVEDNKVNMTVITGHLRKLGVKQVSSAMNGIEAIDHITTALNNEHGTSVRLPDLIFMDCQMPVLDGFDATRRLRSTLQYTRPIIALTASATPGYRQKCLEAGMSDYVTKPFTRQQIYDIMALWLDTTSRQESDMRSVER